MSEGSRFKRASEYVGKKADRWVDRAIEELSDTRSIWCWIYCACYIALVWYCVINYPASANTAITVTGTLVGSIFASYVFGASYVKGCEIKSNGHSKPAKKPVDDPEEYGASD